MFKLTEAINKAKAEGRVPLIAEIKLRSPRDGDLLKGRDSLPIAQEYIRGGACAISVVTEPLHFGGNKEILKSIAAAVKLPVLRKDFIKEKEHVLESKQLGAAAVLLITAMLERNQLAALNNYAHSLGLETVVEVHKPEELERLEGLVLDIVGINNKDILDLEQGVDQTRQTEKLARFIPSNVLILSESGIKDLKDVKKVLAAGADAVLIGTALMQSKDPRRAVSGFVYSPGADK